MISIFFNSIKVQRSIELPLVSNGIECGMNQETRFIILLGSNLGDRLLELETARRLINERIGVVDRSSSVFETEAWGNTNQAAFLNRVVSGRTPKNPHQVMQYALAIEEEMGRFREKKWAPRSIDIDLLFLDDQVITSPELTLPHPLLHQRKFTLVPLCEIFPDFRHPVLNLSMTELLAGLSDPLAVRIFPD
jgi:2-amino-4-hydroxy-6-hydroxymethyldihydropteridine diphosphokinase